MRKNMQALLVGALLSMLSLPLFAHHGNAGYDSKMITVKGTVTEWLWTNPHSFLKFDVKDDKGNVVHWTGEWNAPSTLVNFGFTAKTFKPGDEVTVTLAAAKNGVPLGHLRQVVLPSGQIMKEDESVGKAGNYRAQQPADSQ
jgi:hypothetical protein